MIEGYNTIPRLHAIFGNCVPGFKMQEKDGLRQIYGRDRIDNAFYISETIQEA